MSDHETTVAAAKKPRRGSRAGPALLIGLFVGVVVGVLAGGLVGRALWRDPPTPPATIIQPPTGGPNAALLYLRYRFMLPDTLITAASSHELDEPLSPDLARLLKKNQDAIAGLLRAGAMEHCDFNIEYDLGMSAYFPHLGRMRGAVQVLAADAHRCAADGDMDGAVARIECLLATTKHLRSDRILISCLVGVAIAELAANEIEHLGVDRLDAAQRHRLIASLAFIDEDDPFGFESALLGEKTMALATDVLQGGGLLMDRTSTGVSKVFDEAIAAWDDENAVQRLSEIANSAGGFMDLSGMFIPAFGHAKRSEEMMLTRLHEVRTALREAGP